MDNIAKLFKNIGVWILSFDSTDADGYKTLAMTYNIYKKNNSNGLFLVFVASKPCPTEEIRLSNPNDTHYDNPEQEHEELLCVAKLVNKIAPSAIIVTGARHIDAPVPLKYIKNANEVYGHLVKKNDAQSPIFDIDNGSMMIKLHLVMNSLDEVYIDFMGCVGFFPKLMDIVGEELLVNRLRNTIVPIMGGVMSNVVPQTLSLPGRHPYSTMNQLYDKNATKVFIDFCVRNNIKMFYCTNSKANQYAKFDNDKEMNSAENINGLLGEITTSWFGPHLEGKYVDFDCFTFACYLMMLMGDNDIVCADYYLHLYDNPAIHVLDPENNPTAINNAVWVDANSKVITVMEVTNKWLYYVCLLCSSS